MIKELLSSRRFAPLFWAQFCSALNDNVLKNALVIMLLYGVAADQNAALVTVAGAVFIFPFFVLSALGGEMADKFVKMKVARRLKFAEIFAACFAAAGFYAHSIPLLFVALIRREGHDPRIAFANALVIGTALVNAGLYAVLKGQQNVRYAMVAYVLVYTIIVWANIAVLADGGRPSVTDEAEGP